MTSVLDRFRGRMMFADGTCFEGYRAGADRSPVCGEVVFNTSMTGYQEVITDPSYAGQIVVMTYPQIGNYGANPDDNEREGCAARALVVRELSSFFSPGPGRVSLESFMTESDLPGLVGIDTRAVTRYIRSKGSVVAAIGGDDYSDKDLIELARLHSFSSGESLVAGVSGTLNGTVAGRGAGRAAIVDLGVKQSIVDEVLALGVSVEIFDSDFSAHDIVSGDFDFVVLSNGPGDPEDVPGVVENVRRLAGKTPILGICLGHQVTALALGGRTFKLKFGHHGVNQPVVDARSGRVLITSQNHGYAVADDIADRTDAQITFTNANDGTVEGFADESLMIECVQFHPEASPGPRDSAFLFHEFYKQTRGWRDAKSH
jgi:carbamoyl-phosphate synthase small subunit